MRVPFTKMHGLGNDFVLIRGDGLALPSADRIRQLADRRRGIGFDQLLWLEEEDEEQGLGFFLQYGWAPQNRNEVRDYFGAGLLYRGPIDGRDEDLLGCGLAHTKFSNILERDSDQTYESAIELFYRAQLRPWAAIQPDLQFISNPGGNLRDSLTAGLRFEVVL